MKKSTTALDPEIVAISAVYAALRELESEAQSRVLTYVAAKLRLDTQAFETERSQRTRDPEESSNAGAKEAAAGAGEQADDDLEGISPVARRWMARNGLNSKQLSMLFSLGVDEIDLIAKKVPGKSKKERMHSVFLLKGVAAYLGTGVPRFTHEQLKEACLHYDAFDATNFSHILKSLSGEVAGSKETGYTLTARGLAGATEMVKGIGQS